MRYFIGILFFAGVFVLLSSDVIGQTSDKKDIISEVQNIYTDTLEVVRKDIRAFFPTTESQSRWVDNVYNQMTIDEKIGQLFMVAAYSNKNEAHAQSIDSLIINQKIGGIIFFQGGPVRQIGRASC